MVTHILIIVIDHNICTYYIQSCNRCDWLEHYRIYQHCKRFDEEVLRLKSEKKFHFHAINLLKKNKNPMMLLYVTNDHSQEISTKS